MAGNAFPSWEVSEEQLAKIRDKKIRARIKRRSRAGEAVGAIDAAGILASLPDDLGLDVRGRVRLSDDEMINVISTANKLKAWAAAVEYQIIACFARRQERVNEHDPGFGVWNDVSAYTSDQVALACGVSTASAAGRLDAALRLTAALPATLGRLRAGEVDQAKARIMHQLTSALTDEQAGRVERRVIRDLVGPGRACSYRQWELRIRAAVLDVAPETAEENRRRAKESRGVWVKPEEDEMAELSGLFSAPDAIAAYAHLTRLAKRKIPGDGRTLGQRRADALIEAILGPTPVTGSAAALIREAAADVSFEDADAAVQAAAQDAGQPAADETAADGSGPDAGCDDCRSGVGPTAGEAKAADDSGEPECGCELGSACQACSGSQWLRTSVDLRTLLAGGTGSWDDIAPVASPTTPAASPAGSTPLIQVTVAASTLMGLDQHPGELAGYGPITAGLAREIAADGVWRRLLTDPATGILLDYGDTVYRPPAGLARHVRARDKTCAFPTCTRPADQCDLDHNTAFPDGPTADVNLHSKCRRAHRIKDQAHWHTVQLADHSVLWVTPTGHARIRPPVPVLPDPPEDDPGPDLPDDPPF